MGFFDIHQTKNEPRFESTIPDWYGPPAHVIGKPLGASILMLKTEQCAVALTQFVVYPSGLAFDIVVRFADRVPGNGHASAWEGSDRAMYAIELSDGTPILPYQHEEWPPVYRPDGTLLIRAGGGGNDEGFRFGIWVNPLPPEPFRVIFAWPAAGISEIDASVDMPELVETASQAIILWPTKEP